MLKTGARNYQCKQHQNAYSPEQIVEQWVSVTAGREEVLDPPECIEIHTNDEES